MGFFASDLNLAESFADPKVSNVISPGPARSWGGGQDGTSGMLSNLGTSTQQTSGAFSYNTPSAQQLFSQVSVGSGVTGALGSTPVETSFPEPTNYPYEGPVGSDGNMTIQPFVPSTTYDSGDSAIGISGTTGGDYTPTAQDYRDYFTSGRTTLGLLTQPFGMLGTGVRTAADFNMGINPFAEGLNEAANLAGKLGIDTPYTPTFMGNYTGPGSESMYTGGVSLSPSQQRDMLIDQIAFNEMSDKQREDMGFFDKIGSYFDMSWRGYDPDLDLTIGPWGGVETTPTTQEYVVEDPKDMQVDNIAGGYTMDSDLGSTEEMQEETGLGTSEWDTSQADFSWGDDSSSDAGDLSGTSGFDENDDDAGGWSFDDSSSDSGGGDSGGGGGGSYIATAATQALGEEGLTVFEGWRDYMMGALPTFKSTYGRYRVTAPKIVKAIDKKDNSDNIYNYIWDMHLKPIFDLITEDKDSEKALKDYKVMVRELQNKFLKEKV